MTNYPAQPPPPGYGQVPMDPYMPQRRSNGWAIASLICGIVGCVPFVTSLCATIFGIVGIRKSSDPQVGGRGIAIAGLILGIIGLIGWGAFAGAGGWGFFYAKRMIFDPARQTGNAFVSSLASGDLGTARTYVTSDFPQAELEDLSAQLSGMGQFKGFSLREFDVDSQTGDTFRLTASGTLQFDAGQKDFDAVLVGSKAAGVKVQQFRLN